VSGRAGDAGGDLSPLIGPHRVSGFTLDRIFLIHKFLFLGEILYNIPFTPQKLSAGRENRSGAKGASALFDWERLKTTIFFTSFADGERESKRRGHDGHRGSKNTEFPGLVVGGCGRVRSGKGI